MRHEEETQALEAEASTALHEAWLAALCHPTADFADLAVKDAMIGEARNAGEFEPIAAVLDATFAALRHRATAV